MTAAPDEIDWADEIRIALEERAAMSPDALTGLEANLRFDGPETMETRIFGRLTGLAELDLQPPERSRREGRAQGLRQGRARRNSTPVYVACDAAGTIANGTDASVPASTG